MATVDEKSELWPEAIENWKQALKILNELKESHRLAPVDEPWIEKVEENLARCRQRLEDGE